MNKNTNSFIFLIKITFVFFIVGCQTNAQSISERIRVNQIGFYPNGPKVAVILESSSPTFYVIEKNQKDTVFKGNLSEAKLHKESNKLISIADFSPVSAIGTYQLVVPGLGASYLFEVKPFVFHDILGASIKAFYFQRVSTPLVETYAGKWHRPLGHPDDKVLIHPSVSKVDAEKKRTISSPRGWYDAGDYNKYIVNSGITMATLLSLYEDFPQYFDTITVNIPESGNQIPDLLDEVLWNLRWMLTMQDPSDGGVYHKLTNPDFDGVEMPDEAVKSRYVVQKSTAATLDLAAVTAQSARIFKTFSKEFPGLADSCLIASKRAWAWAKKNPNLIYDQDLINKNFDPDITTGTYGDNNVKDELFWAAAELYATTKEDVYLTTIKSEMDKNMSLPSWSNVEALGYYSLLRNRKELPEASKKELDKIEYLVLSFSNKLINGVSDNPYATVMGKSEKDFIWGSNAVAANQGIALIQAYLIKSEAKYLNYALANLDYLLGRNATGYSFVTGFGDKSPKHPHHRPSEADEVKEPVPGLLVGGPRKTRWLQLSAFFTVRILCR